MVHKRKKYTPQDYIHVGIAFFLIGLFVHTILDVGLINTFAGRYIHNAALVDALQGAALGLSIPIFCISIYFNVRGLILLRSQS